MYNKRSIGKEYEDLAIVYLENNGYEILERNFYSKQGEIDIIARENEYLVFVEVKYRNNNKIGHSLEAITHSKKQRIIKTAKYYIYKKFYGKCPLARVDVVAIQDKEVLLVKDAFWIG